MTSVRICSGLPVNASGRAAVSTFPEPDMSVSASALHLLLARHREIVDLPLEWRIDRQGVVSPFLPVNDEQCEQAAQLLAAALELTVELFEYQLSLIHI